MGNLLSRSAFCNGFERAASNALLISLGSVPLYALTATIGVLVFLLLVLLIYRAAASPSTLRQRKSGVAQNNEERSLTNWHLQIHKDTVELCEMHVSWRQHDNKSNALISPMATLMASEPSATTTHRQPNRIKRVSMIFDVIGLSSANKQVTTRSAASRPLLR